MTRMMSAFTSSLRAECSIWPPTPAGAKSSMRAIYARDGYSIRRPDSKMRCASPTYVDNAIFAGAAPWRASAAVSPIGIT
jgi:hypothetical protein